MSYRSELIQVAAVALAAVQVDDLGSTELDSLLGRNSLTKLLGEVRRERERQEKKWGAQTHSLSWWLAILAEEVGEVADEIALPNPGPGTSDIGELILDARRLGEVARDVLERTPVKKAK